MTEQNYLISVDWFQISCHRRELTPIFEGMHFSGVHRPDGEGARPFIYEVVPAKEFNAMFKTALGVALHGFTLCTVYCDPRTSTLPRSLASIKMGNRLLYSGNWLWYLRDILDALRWQFHNITRIDLCCDFNYFSGELSPVDFIQRYLSGGAYDPDRPSYFRVGGNKYATIGRKIAQTGDDVSCGTTELSSEYLRFGGRNSGVCVYLYNKSRELSEKNHKAYIRDIWAEGCLEDTAEVPVFRLEISVSAVSTNYRRRLTQEEKDALKDASAVKRDLVKDFTFGRLGLDDVATQAEVERLFWIYASKYFRFKVVGPQKFPHNWPDLPLFDVRFADMVKPCRMTKPVEGGVAERNAASTLARLLERCHDLSLETRLSCEEAIKTLERAAQVRTNTERIKALSMCIDHLRMGFNFDEIGRMSIMSARHLKEFRHLVEESAYNELRDLLADPKVAQAVDEHMATTELVKEDVAALEDYFKANGAFTPAEVELSTIRKQIIEKYPNEVLFEPYE